MKKRILSVLTVCALAFSLAACSQTPSENTAQEQPEIQIEISTETSAETQTEAQSEAQTEEQTKFPTEVQTENQSEMLEESRGSSEEAADGSNVLIAYFSWSGNTAEIASYIQEKTGGDVLEIEPLNPYPTDYSEAGNVAERERDENARPEIANLPEDISQYDTVFVGYPKMEYDFNCV